MLEALGRQVGREVRARARRDGRREAPLEQRALRVARGRGGVLLLGQRVAGGVVRLQVAQDALVDVLMMASCYDGYGRDDGVVMMVVMVL